MATAADIYAKARADEWVNQNKNKYYDTLGSAVESQKQAQTEGYNKLMNTLKQQAGTYQQDYEGNARQAYLNSLQSKQSLNDTLQRLGLSNTGLGQSQFLSAENQYAGNLAGLQGQLSKNLAGIDVEKANALSDLNAALATIDKDYYTNKLSMDKYIDEFYNSLYQQGLSQYNADRDYNLSYANYLNNVRSSISGDDLKDGTGGTTGGTSTQENIDLVNSVLGTNDYNKIYELYNSIRQETSLSQAEKDNLMVGIDAWMKDYNTKNQKSTYSPRTKSKLR